MPVTLTQTQTQTRTRAQGSALTGAGSCLARIFAFICCNSSRLSLYLLSLIVNFWT
jgi:hypothetical protein